MKVLQNMKVKDIINRKVIKDELFLLKTNVKSLMLSWRITRTPYLISIILVYFSYIAMPGLTFNSLPEYEESIVSVNVNIRMYNFDDVQCTVIPSVAYGFVTGMNLQLC